MWECHCLILTHNMGTLICALRVSPTVHTYETCQLTYITTHVAHILLQDTSAATLSWALYLLSQPQHGAYRAALHAEVTAATACGNDTSSSSSTSRPKGHIRTSDFDKLRLVDAVIKEVSFVH